MKELIAILKQLEILLKSGDSLALATVVHVDGSAYRRPGARMLIDSNGNWWGGISGGCLEGDLYKKATLAMHQQSIKSVTYDTREEDPFQLGIGLGCQGLIEIIIDPIRDNIEKTYELLHACIKSGRAQYVQSHWKDKTFEISMLELSEIGWDERSQVFTEYLPARTKIWVIGNQFDACSMIESCLNLSWNVQWVGNKQKMRNDLSERVTNCYDWDDPLNLQPTDFIVIMTHDFDRDLAFINQHLIDKHFQYIGILGPQKRFERLKKQISGNLVSDISTPVGLDIGAEGADEIALAIVSEILAVQNGRNGQRLKFRESTIH